MKHLKGGLARHFNAAGQTQLVTYFRKKLAALGLAIPMALLPAVQAVHATPQPPANDNSTRYSQLVDDYQKRFGEIGPHSQILFLDRDIIMDRASTAPAGASQEDALKKAVSDFVAARTGLLLPDSILEILADSLVNGGGQALAIPYTTQDHEGQTGQGSVCFVTGQNADITNKMQQSRIIGLSPRLHPELARAKLLRDLPEDVMRRYTDYHELGHCMDYTFLPKAGFNPMSNPDYWLEMRHQAEIYGEVFATLMLARDGIDHVAEIRADHRLVSIALNGSLLVSTANGDPIRAGFAYVYALHESLWETQRVIDQMGLKTIQSMSPEALANIATAIADKEPLRGPEAEQAITFLLAQKFDLQVWENMRRSDPGVERRYQIAVRVRDKIKEAMVRVFGEQAFDPAKPILSQFPTELSPSFFISDPQAEKMITTITEELTQQLLTDAGGQNATQESLLRATVRRKENLRSMLDSGAPPAMVQRAVIELAVIPLSLRQAVLSIQKGPAAEIPQPANDATGPKPATIHVPYVPMPFHNGP